MMLEEEDIAKSRLKEVDWILHIDLIWCYKTQNYIWTCAHKL